jgi:hypothetical protein
VVRQFLQAILAISVLSIAACSDASDALVDAQVAALGSGTVRVSGQEKAVGQFLDFKLVRQAGQRTGGTCHWSNSLSSSPGELPVASVQVAFNPNTCEQLLKVGHIRQRTTKAPDSRYSWAASSTSASAP